MAEPRRLRVMVLHPLPGVRDRVVAALRNVAELQLVGEAGTFEEAREHLPLCRPDVVLSGAPTAASEALPHLKHVELPEISDALDTASSAEIHRVRLGLLRRLQPLINPPPRLLPAPLRMLPGHAQVELPAILAVGASTGGPNALSTLVQALPAELSIPVVLVQHMPPPFVELLAQRLTAHRKLPFQLAKDGERLQPGRGYIAPGDVHLALRGQPEAPLARLVDSEPENRSRPAVDVLFRSVAEVYGPRALCVVLTGMGEDGKRGSAAIREAGGQVLAQDEATSVVWGMPGSVTKAGLANEVLPLGDLAPAILRRLRLGR